MGKFTGAVKSPAVVQQETQKALGRPRGKRSHPDWDQYSIWLKKDTHRQVRSLLILQEKELSELAQELLEGWLQSRPSET